MTMNVVLIQSLTFVLHECDNEYSNFKVSQPFVWYYET